MMDETMKKSGSSSAGGVAKPAPNEQQISERPPSEVHVMGQSKGDDTLGPATQIAGGTKSSVAIYNRRNITTTVVTENSLNGDPIFRVPLDLESLAPVDSKNWVMWKIKDIRIDIVSINNLGTASGGAQFGQNPDPSNPVADDNQTRLTMINHLTNSRLVQARSNAEVKPDLVDNQIFNHEGYKFAKLTSSSDPRLTSYGEILGVVRGIPAQGQTFQFAINMSSTIEVKGFTLNVESNTTNYTVPDLLDLEAAITTKRDGLNDLNIGFPARTGQVLPSDAIIRPRGQRQVTLLFLDPYNETYDITIPLAQMDVQTIEGQLYAVLSTDIGTIIPKDATLVSSDLLGTDKVIYTVTDFQPSEVSYINPLASSKPLPKSRSNHMIVHNLGPPKLSDDLIYEFILFKMLLDDKESSEAIVEDYRIRMKNKPVIIPTHFNTARLLKRNKKKIVIAQ